MASAACRLPLTKSSQLLEFQTVRRSKREARREEQYESQPHSSERYKLPFLRECPCITNVHLKAKTTSECHGRLVRPCHCVLAVRRTNSVHEPSIVGLTKVPPFTLRYTF